MNQNADLLSSLIRKGVSIPHPQSVFISGEVDPERIDASVSLHPGTRLQGASLSIGPESVIGKETPATVVDCQIGKGVSLKGGYVEGSVFLDGSSVGSSAHVRPGCLLEEEACAAHAVGLKQTILYPFVTLGSLINFCDVWMTGGTSRKNHSEVGSSFIHFNFTPHGDKATASLLGDPASGLLLNQSPVFLGGQGGIVGPVHMAHGVVQAAGSICRRDLKDPDHLFQSAVKKERWQPYATGNIRDMNNRVSHNLTYIGSLIALRTWYRDFRSVVMPQDVFTRACLEGADQLLKGAVEERCKQLHKLVGLAEGWDALPGRVERAVEENVGSSELRKLAEESLPKFGKGYTAGMQALDPEQGDVIIKFFERQQHRFALCAEG